MSVISTMQSGFFKCLFFYPWIQFARLNNSVLLWQASAWDRKKDLNNNNEDIIIPDTLNNRHLGHAHGWPGKEF